MENLVKQIPYIRCTFHELDSQDQLLINAAKKACETSYAPYSNFNVGAAAELSNGKIVSGSNQENAAYPSGTCAERCTIFHANAQYPDASVKKLAIAAIGRDDQFTSTPITPCGACRQVLIETEHRYKQPMKILLYGQEYIYIINSCKDLLPFQFNSDSL